MNGQNNKSMMRKATFHYSNPFDQTSILSMTYFLLRSVAPPPPGGGGGGGGRWVSRDPPPPRAAPGPLWAPPKAGFLIEKCLRFSVSFFRFQILESQFLRSICSTFPSLRDGCHSCRLWNWPPAARRWSSSRSIGRRHPGNACRSNSDSPPSVIIMLMMVVHKLIF